MLTDQATATMMIHISIPVIDIIKGLITDILVFTLMIITQCIIITTNQDLYITTTIDTNKNA